MRNKLAPSVREISLRQLRAEFARLFGLIGRAVEANRADGHEVFEIYVDDTTDELVIVHANGTKRIA